MLRDTEIGAKVAKLLRKTGISEPTFYNWKYGGMTVSDAKRLGVCLTEDSISARI